MLETLRNAFKIKDIRKRIIFTFLMLVVIRIGSQLPIPGVDSEVFDNDAVVSVETLIEAGIVKHARDGVKILGNGELTKKLTVQANAFSAGAVEKIEAVGGKAEVI